MSKIPIRVGGKTRIMIAIYVFLIILSPYVILHDYNSHINQSQEQVLSQLKSIVCTAALQSDGELQETNQELSDSLYRSSHELIGPVASRKGLINLLINEDSGKKTGGYFENLDGTVEKLDNTIRNHAFVHEIKQQKPTFEEIDIRKLIEDVLKKLKPCNQGIQVEMSIPEVLPIKSDKLLLETMFRELLTNSCQYQCRLDRRKSIIQVGGKLEEGGNILITVKNNGDRISENIGNKIFDMFYRGNEDSSGQELGLYKVNFAINRLNGEIRFESIKDQGTTFI